NKPIRVEPVEGLPCKKLALVTGERVPVDPVRFKWAEGKVAMDLIGTTYAQLFLVSDRFVQALEAGLDHLAGGGLRPPRRAPRGVRRARADRQGRAARPVVGPAPVARATRARRPTVRGATRLLLRPHPLGRQRQVHASAANDACPDPAGEGRAV